jgi:hypothetical protein
MTGMAVTAASTPWSKIVGAARPLARSQLKRLISVTTAMPIQSLRYAIFSFATSSLDIALLPSLLAV